MQANMAAVDAILAAGVVGFAFDTPRTFKSGIKSPVYLDNRRLLMHPEAWRVIIQAMRAAVQALDDTQPTVPVDKPLIIAGIETAGIPHSAALAYEMRLPTVFVRKQAKEHGLQQRIEGGDVRGRDVVLIEDQITTGGSSLSGVAALREAGATVNHCLAITSYGFREASEGFKAAGVALHVLVTFADLLPALDTNSSLSTAQREMLERWLADPQSWSA